MQRVRLTPVSRVELRTSPKDRSVVIHEILRWIENRIRSRLPADAWDGANFDTGLSVAAPAKAVVGEIDEIAYWGVRLRFDDTRIPNRSWHTEIVFSDAAPENRIIVRLAIMDVDETSANEPFERTVPGVVQQICANISCMDGALRLIDEPRAFSALSDFDDAILDPKRTRPILVFGALSTSASVDKQRDQDIYWLAQRLSGVCHVATMDHRVSDEIIHRYGKAFSVFGNAAKLYLPDIDRDNILPFDHPLFYLNRVSAPRLLNQIVWRGLARRRAGDLPRFEEIATSHRASVAALRNDQEIEQLNSELEQANEEITQLKSEVAGFDALFDEAAERESAADAHVQTAEATVQDLKEENGFYVQVLRHISSPELNEFDIPLPSARVFDTWLQVTCGRSIVLTEHARASIDTLPDDETWFERFGVALRGIADLAEGKIKPTGQNIQIGWGVEISPCGKTDGFDDYDFYHESRKFRSTWHAKWGSGTDIRHAFRIYFFWDTKENLAIVQSVDEHFDNRRTN